MPGYTQGDTLRIKWTGLKLHYFKSIGVLDTLEYVCTLVTS